MCVRVCACVCVCVRVCVCVCVRACVCVCVCRTQSTVAANLIFIRSRTRLTFPSFSLLIFHSCTQIYNLDTQSLFSGRKTFFFSSSFFLVVCSSFVLDCQWLLFWNTGCDVKNSTRARSPARVCKRNAMMLMDINLARRRLSVP